MNKIFQALVFIFIIILPWQTRWIFFDLNPAGQVWEYGRLSLYASWLLLIVAALIFLLKHPQEWRFSKQWSVYLIIVYCLSSLFWSPVPVVSSYYLALIFSTSLAVYLLSKATKTVKLAFIISGFVQAVLAIVQFFSQEIVANKWLGLASHNPADLGASVVEVADQRWLRAYGALPHPNILGAWLALAIIFSLAAWWQIYQQGDQAQWSKKFIKATWWHLSLLMIAITSQSIALSLTFSRSAVLGLVTACLVVLVLALKNKQVMLANILVKYLVILVLVIGATNWYFSGAWQQRIFGQGRLENISRQERISSWQQIHWSNPKEIIFGQGLGLNSYQAWQAHPEQAPYNFQPIHNVYLLALAEVGVVGILILVFIVWQYFYKKYRLDYLSLALLLTVLIIALFDHYFWTSWTGWLMIGVVFAIIHNKE